jgi:hypothetical protein
MDELTEVIKEIVLDEANKRKQKEINYNQRQWELKFEDEIRHSIYNIIDWLLKNPKP